MQNSFEQHIALQRQATNPQVSAWMLANAGAGKTRVLIDRMLRLLLPPIAALPEQVLCVTYTRAAAAEMQDRLLERALHWSTAPLEQLKHELYDLTQTPANADMIRAAQQLSARLDEARGGLNIKTMHAFCESLLKRFAPEAGVIPHFSIAEEGAQVEQLQKKALEAWWQQQDDDTIEQFLSYSSQRSYTKMLENVADGMSNTLYAAPHAVPLPAAIEPPAGHTIETLIEALYTKEGIRRAKIKNPNLLPYAEQLEQRANSMMLQQHQQFYSAIQQITQHYTQLKQQFTVLDFADLIAYTEKLLSRTDYAQWVLYKLDGGLRHILLDEAQDTSPDQWRILRALSSDFFSGNNRHQHTRTMFAVGDSKQSIYSFRGADHRNLQHFGDLYAQQARAIDHAWCEVKPGGSFRSAPCILQLADAMARYTGIESTPHFAVGHAYRHGTQQGYVALYPARQTLDAMADDVVHTIAQCINKRIVLPSTGQPITYGDVLILVRTRTHADTVRQALQLAGMPMQSMDKTPLTQEPAVAIAMLLMGFVCRPQDDLNLAAILRGAIGGLSDDALFELCHNRSGSLIAQLYARRHQPVYNAVYQRLRHVYVQFKKYQLPSDFIIAIAPLLRRLLPHSTNALDILQNKALTYAGHATPSVVSFLHYLQQHNPLIASENNRNDNKIRIMTIHSAKGLEAGMVFIVCPDYGLVKTDHQFLNMPNGERMFYRNSVHNVKPPLVLQLRENDKNQQRDEEMRLLYVAVTRARDMLYIVGQRKEKSHKETAYHILASAMQQLPNAVLSANEVYTLGHLPTVLSSAPQLQRQAANNNITLPAWINQRAAFEYKKQTIRPSQVYLRGDDLPRSAFEGRGVLVHQALHKLPSIAPTYWITYWQEWCAPFAHIDAAVLQQTFNRVERILMHPQWQGLFYDKHSLPEVPIAGDVPNIGRISGRIDRLWVQAQRVLLVDYKTGLFETLPHHYQQQVQLYAAALQTIYPNHIIEASLLVVDASEPYLHNVPLARGAQTGVVS